MGIVLALALSAPVVGVRTDGAAPCDTNAFARELRALRPELAIAPIDAELSAPAEAWLASLEGVPSNQAVLRVTGNPTPLVRSLAGQDCRRAVQIAASIVDGLLDQLPREAPEPFGVSSALRPSLGILGGVGVLQGPIDWVPSFALGLRLTLGVWELVGAADIGTLATLPLVTADQGSVGLYKALPFDFEAGVGYAPRFGPGSFSLDALIGLSVVRVWTTARPPALFNSKSQLSVEAFFGLAAGYTLELPARFSVGIRLEERWSPSQATVSVDVGPDSVVTRAWVFAPTLFAGWRFF